ncbi:MAG: 4Fe-4S binding protein [Candidatus Odinarchaeia archaeon]
MPPTVDVEKCNGCGTCKDICPADPPVFELSDKAQVANPDACLECGACESSCPTGAISL